MSKKENVSGKIMIQARELVSSELMRISLSFRRLDVPHLVHVLQLALPRHKSIVALRMVLLLMRVLGALNASDVAFLVVNRIPRERLRRRVDLLVRLRVRVLMLIIGLASNIRSLVL